MPGSAVSPGKGQAGNARVCTGSLGAGRAMRIKLSNILRQFMYIYVHLCSCILDAIVLVVHAAAMVVGRQLVLLMMLVISLR